MNFFIVAVDDKWGIAKDYKIPWRYKEDFTFFKEKTQGAACCMGYNTFAEIAEIRKYPNKNSVLLPGRTNYVITSKSDLTVNEDIRLTDSIESMTFLSFPIAYIGGKGIYDYAMDNYLGSCAYGYITRIKHDHDCNLHFDSTKLQENFLLAEILSETDDLRFEKWERIDKAVWNNRKEYKHYER